MTADPTIQYVVDYRAARRQFYAAPDDADFDELTEMTVGPFDRTFSTGLDTPRSTLGAVDLLKLALEEFETDDDSMQRSVLLSSIEFFDPDYAASYRAEVRSTLVEMATFSVGRHAKASAACAAHGGRGSAGWPAVSREEELSWRILRDKRLLAHAERALILDYVRSLPDAAARLKDWPELTELRSTFLDPAPAGALIPLLQAAE